MCTNGNRYVHGFRVYRERNFKQVVHLLCNVDIEAWCNKIKNDSLIQLWFYILDITQHLVAMQFVYLFKFSV